jgi:hypothetical protein
MSSFHLIVFMKLMESFSSGFLLKYLVNDDKSLELKKKLAAIDEATETDYGGSRTYKDIQVLVVMLQYQGHLFYFKYYCRGWQVLIWIQMVQP